MLSYQNFTPIERESMVIALERQREKIQELINAVAVDSFEFTITPAEARQLVALVRPYYMPIAHEIEDHPGYEPE